MNDRVKTFLESRRERLRRATDRPLAVPQGDPRPLPAADREKLLDDARDLYWNELEWENITEEERVDGGPLVDLAFPGFLAFVRGLLLDEAMPDSLAPASPRPEVVEDVLAFLGGRVIALKEEITGTPDGEEEQDLRVALDVTSRLVDLVLYHLYGLTDEEISSVEALPTAGA